MSVRLLRIRMDVINMFIYYLHMVLASEASWTNLKLCSQTLCSVGSSAFFTVVHQSLAMDVICCFYAMWFILLFPTRNCIVLKFYPAVKGKVMCVTFHSALKTLSTKICNFYLFSLCLPFYFFSLLFFWPYACSYFIATWAELWLRHLLLPGLMFTSLKLTTCFYFIIPVSAPAAPNLFWLWPSLTNTQHSWLML